MTYSPYQDGLIKSLIGIVTTNFADAAGNEINFKMVNVV